MTSCSVVIPKLKRLLESSKNRAEDLMKTMQVTREGEVLSETLDTAVKGLDLIANKNFSELPLLDRRGLVNSVPAMVARSHLKDVFQGAIGRNANSKSVRQDLVLKTAEYVDGEVHLSVTPKGQNKHYTYRFEPNANVSKNTLENGNRLFIPEFSQVFSSIDTARREVNGVLTHQEQAKAARKSLDEMYEKLANSKSTEELLKSSSSTSLAFNYKRSKKRKYYNHGSKEHMKGLLADLHGMTDNSIDSETYDYYNGLLDNMHEHFFRDMSVHIDENADHTFGWVNLDKKHILLNVSSTWHEGMSNEEVYMHELIHTMTAWGLKQEGFDGSRMRARLNSLRKTAYKNMSWKTIAEANPSLTPQAAKARFEYIFNDDNSDDEFLAHALTNPAIMKQLSTIRVKGEKKPGILNAIIDFFSSLMDSVFGNYSFKNRNGNLKDEIHVLAFKLAEINADADAKVSEGNLFTAASSFIDGIEGRVEEFITKATSKLDKTSPVKIPKNPTRMQEVMLVASFFTKGIYNKHYRDAAGTFFSLYGLKPTSSLREVIRSLLPTVDDGHYEVQREGLQASNIDNMRNLHNTASAKSVIDGFNKDLTENEEIALTSVLLESNGSTLFQLNKNRGKGYSTKQLAGLLRDTGMRKRTIGRLEAQVGKLAGKRANWVVAQANGLGKLMATGKGHEAQMTNSFSIVKGYGSDERFAVNFDLVHAVEELAALRALDYQNITELKTVADLIVSEEKGVRNIVNLYNNFKEDSKDELFADDAAHMLEGYVKELFDDTIEVRYEKLSDKEELEKQGYELVSEVENGGLRGGTKLGVYVSKSFSRAERLRGSVAIGNPQGRGLSLKDIRYKQFGDNKSHAQVYFENDKIQLNKKAVEINKKLSQGVKFDEIEEGAVPIINATGKTVDYRQMMEKSLKAKFLKQDRAVSRVLSRTTGTVIDKVARKEQNERVLDLIKDNVRNVYDVANSRDNLEEYTLISAHHEDPEIRRLFSMLPKSYADFANARADKSLPVPSKLMHQYFGYTHYRFTDIPGISKLPESVKHIINIIEAYWMDLVKIAKGNVLLKMPIVLVTNIVSNVLYAINTGSNPITLVKDYRDSIRDVKAFMAAHKEAQQLKIELASHKQDYMNTKFTPEELIEYEAKIKTLTDKVNRLEKEMLNSEVKELFDIGMYQSVIEDIEMYKLGDSNRVSDGMDSLLSKLPTAIKTPLQIAYLSKETAWYKINQEVLQLSDLVARDVMNRKQKRIEQEQADGKRDLPVEYRDLIGRMESKDRRRILKGVERERFFQVAKRSRHANLLTAFVNYQLPNGRGEEYLNRIGVLMFTKYLKRIQQVIATTGTKHSVRTALTVAASGFLLDADLIQDQNLLVKAFDGVDSGALGIVPLYSPMDILLNTATPALVKLIPGF